MKDLPPEHSPTRNASAKWDLATPTLSHWPTVAWPRPCVTTLKPSRPRWLTGGGATARNHETGQQSGARKGIPEWTLVLTGKPSPTGTQLIGPKPGSFVTGLLIMVPAARGLFGCDCAGLL